MQKLLWFIFALVLIDLVQTKDDSLIRSNLVDRLSIFIAKEQRTTQNYGKYIKDLTSATERISGKLTTPGEIQKLSSRLTGTITNLLTNVLNGKTSTIQTMKTQELKDNSIKEWFGVAVFENNAVYYLIIKGNTWGTIQTIEELKHNYKEECRNILWKKECAKWDEPYIAKRKPNVREKMIIKKALASKSLDAIRTEYFNFREQIDKEVYEHAEKEREKGGATPTPGKSEGVYSNEKKLKFLQNLKRLVEKKSIAMPAGYNALIKNIQTNAYINMETFGASQTAETCKKYQLPKDVQNILEAVAGSSKPVTTTDVDYKSRKTDAYLEEITGFAVKEKDRIFFSYIRSVSTGEIPYRWDYLTREKCVTFLWVFKKCFDYKEIQVKSVTQQEKEIIQNALSASNAKLMKNKVETMKITQILISKTQKIYSPDGKWSAVISDNGLIYVGRTPDPISNKKFTIGISSSKTNAPYSLQIKDNGSLYIINRNNEVTWGSGTAYKGEAPYQLQLDNAGNLYLLDATNKIIYTGKN